MKIVMTELVSDKTHLVTWLPHDSKVRVGSVLTLKGDDKVWKVTSQFSTQDLREIKSNRDFQGSIK